MLKRLFLNILFLILCNGASASEDRNLQLDTLFNQLKNTKNLYTAKEIENKIWKLWTTHPSEESLTKLLAKGSEYMSQNQLTSAHNVFSKVIELDPKWPEAWNKRATVLFLMKEYDLSLIDIEKTLDLEPRHFGALSGRAQIYIDKAEYQKALDNLIQTREIYPLSRGNKVIPKLEKILNIEQI